jgi:hypothetical protein
MDDFIDHTGHPTATCPGIGFTLLATRLPASAISIFTEIACLDRLMSISSSENASGSKLGFLLDVRNATLHRLCCLGPLNEQSENTTVDVTLYEAIKLAAMIYCHGVLLAIPPHNGWLAQQSALLRDILRLGHRCLTHEACRDAYLWVIFVGGIVSRDATEGPFFEKLFQDMLQYYGTGWQAIERNLSAFIWTDLACKLEAQAFWRRCTLEIT